MSGSGLFGGLAGAGSRSPPQKGTERASDVPLSSPITLVNPEPDAYDNLGWSPALDADGTTALVGAPYEATDAGEDVGSAYVFTRTGTGERPADPVVLPHPDPGPTGRFGWSVALSADGSTALVGAPYTDTTAGESTGAAYVFARTEAGWVAHRPVTLSNPEPDELDRFGVAVTLSADVDHRARRCGR